MRRVITVIVAAVALLGLAAAGLVAAGCGDQSSSVPSDAVATVGDVSVTKADFQKLMTQAKTQMEASGMTVPTEGTATYHHYVAQIVQYLVQEQVVEQSAADLGVSVTDQEVDAQVKQLEDAYGGEKKVVSLLKEQGMTMALLKRSIRGQTLAQRAIEVVTKDAKVSDAEIKAYWTAHKSEYVKDKTTNTLAKAKDAIKQELLSAKQQKLWTAWLDKRVEELGVAYAAGFDPAVLNAASSASPSPASGG
jgi:foldase protein PrsA